MIFRTLAVSILSLTSVSASDLVLRYAEPASAWTEALPVGNGRLGAMVFGGTARERIQFNEDTVWQGEPHDYSNPGAAAHLAEIRALLTAGKQAEAETLALETFMSVPLRQKAYQAFGDLTLEFEGAEDVRGYRRSLDLDSAAAEVEYESGGVRYRREVFASHPANVIVVRLTASGGGRLAFRAALTSAHAGAAVKAIGSEVTLAGGVSGGAIRFEARLTVETDGKVTADGAGLRIQRHRRGDLVAHRRDELRQLPRRFGRPSRAQRPDAGGFARQVVRRLARHEHLRDHQGLFRRVSLDLGGAVSVDVPTDARIRNFGSGDDDPQLVALLFQYGRYLLIASSRDGGQPANLQGLWNDSNQPPWDSKYTVNINTEMNYWPAELTNLPECHLPLFDLIEDCSRTGAKTARTFYDAPGWVLHHNTDFWRGTAPINHSNHGIWPTGGAWLCQQLW